MIDYQCVNIHIYIEISMPVKRKNTFVVLNNSNDLLLIVIDILEYIPAQTINLCRNGSRYNFRLLLLTFSGTHCIASCLFFFCWKSFFCSKPVF